MEKGNFFRRVIEKVKGPAGITVLGAAALMTPGAQASQRKVAEAMNNIPVIEATFNAKIKLAQTPAEKAKLEGEKEIALAKARAKAEVAKAEDADEQQKKLSQKGNPKPVARTSDYKDIGVTPKNKAETTVTHRVVDIVDENGKVIGQAEEGSKAWKELEEKKLRENIRKTVNERGTIVIDRNGPMVAPINEQGFNTGGEVVTSRGEGGANVIFHSR